jgi:hypothetical protein
LAKKILASERQRKRRIITSTADCFCSADGTKIPGEIEVAQVPQMVTLTFNGAMNIDNLPIYQQVTLSQA